MRNCPAPLRCCLGALALTAPLWLQAQTLPALLEAALATDPALAAARAQVQVQEQRLTQARASRGPSVGFSLVANDTRYRERLSGNGDRSFANQQAALQINQPLFRPALGHAIDAAQAQLEQAEAGLQQAQSDAMLRLIDATFDALKTRDALHLLHAQRVLTDEQLAAAKRKFQLGATSVTDVREAEAQVDGVAAQLHTAGQELELRMQVLAELTGNNPEGLLTRGLTGKQLPKVTSDSVLQWLATATAQSAQLRQAQQVVTAAQAEVRRAEQGHLPTVDLVGTVQRYNDTGTPVSISGRRGDSAQLGININVPLYTSGATQARVEETRALQAKAEGDMAALRRTIAVQVRQAFSQNLSAVGQVKALEAALRSAELSYLANKRGFEVGMKVTAEVLDAQSRVFEVKRDLSRARYDAWATYERLRATSGQLDGSDFVQLEELLVALPPDTPITPGPQG